ncbi:MAG: hypothetical protein FWC56_05740, partial [Phycisphaerae bacterium]|nr:hypothetical protein [Phycisphaerae bacterium]
MSLSTLKVLGDEADGNYYVANSMLDARVADEMANEMATGPKRVATLKLQVAGVPGTYQLWTTYGSVYLADPNASNRHQQMLPGPVFTINVGGE